jgi:hypothetical protein
MSAVIAVLAEYRAKKQVKEMLRREGHKVSAYTAAEIEVMANVWAAMHRGTHRRRKGNDRQVPRAN